MESARDYECAQPGALAAAALAALGRGLTCLAKIATRTTPSSGKMLRASSHMDVLVHHSSEECKLECAQNTCCCRPVSLQAHGPHTRPLFGP